MRLVASLVLGALLAVPFGLRPDADLPYAAWIGGFFALILAGLAVQVVAGGRGTLAVLGATLAYWGAATVVLALGAPPRSDIVALLIAAAISGTVVIAVASVANALGSRSAVPPSP